MLQAYRQHTAERAALGIPPLPLDAKQVSALIELIKAPPAGEEAFLLDLLTHRVPPGVDDAAKVKASASWPLWREGEVKEPTLISTAHWLPSYWVPCSGATTCKPLIDLLADAEVGGVAAEGLKKTLLVFDLLSTMSKRWPRPRPATPMPRPCMQSWADAEWFKSSRPEVAEEDHRDRVQGARRNQY